MNHVNGHTFQLCFHSEKKIQTYFVIKTTKSVGPTVFNFYLSCRSV